MDQYPSPFMELDDDDDKDLPYDPRDSTCTIPPKGVQSQFSIPTFIRKPGEVHTPRYTKGVEDTALPEDLEDGSSLGIVEYTMRYLEAHERRGGVVPRHFADKSWKEKVEERFGDDVEKQRFFILQLYCALINDCWVRDDFEIKDNDYSLIEDPKGVRDATALRVLRWPKTFDGQFSTIMLFQDDAAQSDISSRMKVETGRVVVLPFLGLQVLKNIRYLDVAVGARRGDGKPLDEDLMKAVWRGVVFNMFYFEKEDVKLKKVAEEAWTSVQQLRADVSGSPSRKRKLEDRYSPVEQCGQGDKVRKM